MPRSRVQPNFRPALLKVGGATAALGLHLAVLGAIMLAPSSKPEIEAPAEAVQVRFVEIADEVVDAAQAPDPAIEPAADIAAVEPEAIPEPPPQAVAEPTGPEPEPVIESPPPEPEPQPEPAQEPPPPEPVARPEPEPAPEVAERLPDTVTSEQPPKPQARPEQKPEPKPQPKPEPKPQPKQQAKPQLQQQAKPKPQPQSKPVIKPAPGGIAQPPAGAAAAPAAPKAPPKPVDPDRPRMIGKVDYLGKRPSPVYPRASERRGEQGRVVVRVLISAQGTVLSATVRSSSGYTRLDDAAVTAARSARFKPYTENGIAYQAMADIPFDFVL